MKKPFKTFKLALLFFALIFFSATSPNPAFTFVFLCILSISIWLTVKHRKRLFNLSVGDVSPSTETYVGPERTRKTYKPLPLPESQVQYSATHYDKIGLTKNEEEKFSEIIANFEEETK